MKTTVTHNRTSVSALLGLGSFVAASICLQACQTPNQPNSVPLAQVVQDLPPDWVELPPGDWHMTYLDAPTRAALLDFRKEIAAERKTSAFKTRGGFTEPTNDRWREVNDECKISYCANAVVIGRNLTPELAGTALSVNEAYMNSSVVGDVDFRQMQDDWARFWLMNKPSMLSPYPIVNTGGRP